MMNDEGRSMIETTEMDDAVIPEFRQKEGATGTPLLLADGQTWLLADGGLLNELDTLRDRIDDMARLRGEVQMVDIRQVAFVLLLANYQLTEGEAACLILGAETQPLTDAVSRALFGDPNPRRTYTSWAAGSMLANGIDPASVPSRLRQVVLDILVRTNRTVPAGEYIESAEAARKIAVMRSRVKPVPAPVESAAPVEDPSPVAIEPAPDSEATLP